MVTTVSTPFSFAQKGDTPQNEVAFFRHFLPLRNRLQKTVISFCAK
ncbi:hypothetical protein HMPREF9442_03411 [Paraprevotella xylaniphila YIT 11841]|uniref:Uncharacterized protein n=1 Tax=Paraprevotella xylaniphila YIT 11841 TaxID=762982 RepID=F3QYW6_9BACT|nr:hypothetical protein HMPREF9442_03411 [Paraprevotella xylaniphila YIT 11841]